MTYAELARRAASLVGLLAEPVDARRALSLVRELGPGFDEGRAADPAATIAERIELRGLAERLGRRSAEGIPFASIARALSADLHGSPADAARIRLECDGQLLTFGL